jgi:hypothetical protein
MGAAVAGHTIKIAVRAQGEAALRVRAVGAVEVV